MRKLAIPKEFLGAFKAGHRPAAREFIDEELSFKLLEKVLSENCEESRNHLLYLTKFNNEFHKNVIKKGDENALHNTKDLRRNCYARENAKNRDIFIKLNSSEISSDYKFFCSIHEDFEEIVEKLIEDNRFFEAEISV